MHAWLWKTLWSKETHFTLDEAVNIQNFQLWGTASHNVDHALSLHPGFMVDFILSFFFKKTFLKVLKNVSLQVPATATFFSNILLYSY